MKIPNFSNRFFPPINKKNCIHLWLWLAERAGPPGTSKVLWVLDCRRGTEGLSRTPFEFNKLYIKNLLFYFDSRIFTLKMSRKSIKSFGVCHKLTKESTFFRNFLKQSYSPKIKLNTIACRLVWKIWNRTKSGFFDLNRSTAPQNLPKPSIDLKIVFICSG